MRAQVVILSVVLVSAIGMPRPTAAEERLAVVKTPKHITAFSQSAVVEGRWKLNSRRSDDFSLARVNASAIHCSRLTKMCEETVAELRTPEDGERLGIASGELLATCHTYEVTEWSETTLVAVSRKAAADLVIKVDFSKESAERFFRERADPRKYSSYTLE